MKAAIAHNFNAYFLALLGVLCVQYGFHSGNVALGTLGNAAWAAALYAFKSSPPPPDYPAQVPDPK
jgi:hypothetical protein